MFLFLQVTEVIAEDFNILSRAYVYWEEMIKDENENEGRRFEVEMAIALRKLRDILCVMCSVHELQSEDGCSVDSNVMPHYVRNLSRSLRFERDYDVAVSTTKVLRFMSRRYSNISSHYPS